jgi:DNA-binding transcriptional ArsR family regulator
MALPSFSQHLDVLEDCGLVRSRKMGRVGTYRLVTTPLQSAEQWLARNARCGDGVSIDWTIISTP